MNSERIQDSPGEETKETFCLFLRACSRENQSREERKDHKMIVFLSAVIPLLPKYDPIGN